MTTHIKKTPQTPLLSAPLRFGLFVSTCIALAIAISPHFLIKIEALKSKKIREILILTGAVIATCTTTLLIAAHTFNHQNIKSQGNHGDELSLEELKKRNAQLKNMLKENDEENDLLLDYLKKMRSAFKKLTSVNQKQENQR